MIKRKSESTTCPKLIEESSTTVFVRENIVSEERKSMDDSTLTMYIYDETQYTKAEYESRTVAQTRADVDYIAILQEIEL